MNTLIIRDGFDVMTFRWDELTPLARVDRMAGPAALAYADYRPAAVTPRVESAVFEEEAERWDGLS